MAFRGTGGLVPFFGGSPLHGLRRELDRFFEDYSGGGRGSWIPPVDVRENDQELTVEVELAGVKPEQVAINVDNGILTVSGERRTERRDGDDQRFHVVERSYGTFTRSFTLPQGVNDDQITADFDDGVLRVHIPKSALPQPRRIEIGREASKGEPQVSGASSSSKRQAPTPRGPAETSDRPAGNRMVAKEP
jgi:HSP20 family protein